MLKRREASDIYITHVYRHCWSRENPVKRYNIANESHSVGWKLYILSFYWVLSPTVMSTDMSQVSVALFPSFYLKKLLLRYFNLNEVLINWKKSLVHIPPPKWHVCKCLQIDKDLHEVKNISPSVWCIFKCAYILPGDLFAIHRHELSSFYTYFHDTVRN